MFVEILSFFTESFSIFKFKWISFIKILLYSLLSPFILLVICCIIFYLIMFFRKEKPFKITIYYLKRALQYSSRALSNIFATLAFHPLLNSFILVFIYNLCLQSIDDSIWTWGFLTILSGLVNLIAIYKNDPSTLPYVISSSNKSVTAGLIISALTFIISYLTNNFNNIIKFINSKENLTVINTFFNDNYYNNFIFIFLFVLLFIVPQHLAYCAILNFLSKVLLGHQNYKKTELKK